MAESLVIDVAWMSENRARLETISLPMGACVRDALVALSAQLAPAVENLDTCPVGIYGRVVSREQRLSKGDRVELYRELPNDPKTARRARARQLTRR